MQEQVIRLATKQLGERKYKEIIVLVCAKDSEVKQYIYPQPQPWISEQPLDNMRRLTPPLMQMLLRIRLQQNYTL